MFKMRLFQFQCLLVAGVWLGGAVSAQGQALPPEVMRALQQAQLPPTALHVVVAPAAGGPARLSHRADLSVNPASLMKLVTTSAAFELLGPAHVWRTTLWADGPIVNGALRGHLYVQGQGDPKLVVERLWLLLRRLKALGIDRIEGDLVLDRSAFEVEANDPAQFDGEPHRPYNVSPDALVVNFKSVLLHFVPDARAGVARVHAEPPLAGVRVPEVIPLQKGPCTDYRSALKADFSDPARFVFQGTFPSECGERIWPVAYADPPSHAARAIEGVWRAIGGQLVGRVREGRIPAEARTLIYTESPTLAELTRDINKFSNNLMADQVFLTLSQQALGVGRFEASREIVQQWWHQRIREPGLVVDNGSGLSRHGRMTAQGLNLMLQRAWTSAYMSELMASMPVTGQDGTLRRSKAQASAHLKTGSLRNVLAVAGYVDGPVGQRWVLVAIIEHPQAQSGRAVLDALVDWSAQLTHQP
ncbi:MAG: D-alanyl-D-alanine carboxypeptidase/D-alanyl-D-alanine-endopeptidase [Alphaproteobacteria bacterium]|nr:D-alanyl-D-alanine carboxypeptidase/D-alanyl-D-alanine-endopeptidase [Alphaproteobacteria bacterium]